MIMSIDTIFLIAGTSNKSNSGSSGTTLELEVSVSTQTDEIDLDTDSNSLTHKYGSKGSTNEAIIYRWDSDKWPGNFNADDVTKVDLDISGSNSWRPANMFLILVDSNGTYTLKSACANWPENNCFSTETSDCDGNAKKERKLYPPQDNCGN